MSTVRGFRADLILLLSSWPPLPNPILPCSVVARTVWFTSRLGAFAGDIPVSAGAVHPLITPRSLRTAPQG